MLDIRCREFSKENTSGLRFEVRGPFPVEAYWETVAFSVSVFDSMEEELYPVLSVLEKWQEPHTVAFHSLLNAGEITPGTGVVSWAPIGVFIPEIMIGPYGGTREFVAVVRMIDLNSNLRIINGLVADGKDGVYSTDTCRFSCSLGDSGYLRSAHRLRKLQSIAIGLAASVAVSDDSIDSSELDVIREKIEKWIVKYQVFYGVHDQFEQWKSFKEDVHYALNCAINGEIDTDALLNSLHEEAGPKFWYEVLELCYDVMAADGVAESGELQMIKRIGDVSGIDASSLEKLRDRKIVGLEISANEKNFIFKLLGIDLNWDTSRIQKHLRKEYNKWNGRLNTLPEGKARESAQSMLDMIGKAFNDYR